MHGPDLVDVPTDDKHGSALEYGPLVSHGCMALPVSPYAGNLHHFGMAILVHFMQK